MQHVSLSNLIKISSECVQTCRYAGACRIRTHAYLCKYTCVRAFGRHGVWVICHHLCIVAINIGAMLHFFCKYSYAKIYVCMCSCIYFYNYFCIILHMATVCRLSFWCSYALYVLQELRRVASHLYRIVSYRMTYLRHEMPYTRC